MVERTDQGRGRCRDARALGRYWMEHPQFEGGNAILADQNEFVTDASGEAFFSPDAGRDGAAPDPQFRHPADQDAL
jgi:hypothetical protein